MITKALGTIRNSSDRCLLDLSSILDCNLIALQRMGRIVQLAKGSQEMEKAAKAAYRFDSIVAFWLRG
jgi:hypothetical protein